MHAWPHNKLDKWLKLYRKRVGTLSALMIRLASFKMAIEHTWTLVVVISFFFAWIRKKCWCSDVAYIGLRTDMCALSWIAKFLKALRYFTVVELGKGPDTCCPTHYVSRHHSTWKLPCLSGEVDWFCFEYKLAGCCGCGLTGKCHQAVKVTRLLLKTWRSLLTQ